MLSISPFLLIDDNTNFGVIKSFKSTLYTRHKVDMELNFGRTYSFILKISECTTFDVLAITSCGKFRLTSFLIRWNQNFMGLLNIQKIYYNFLLRSSRILVITMTSYESIRRCRWSWSCGLRSILLCILGFKVITIDSPASSMAPMVYLHGSCFA